MEPKTASFVVSVITDNEGYSFYYHEDLDGKILDRLEAGQREYMEPKPAKGEKRKACIVTLSGNDIMTVEPFDN
jgi:hypothetical protein